MAAARMPLRRQQRKEHARIRRGMGRRRDDFAVPVLHGRNEPARLPRVAEDVLDEKGGGRLAVGSGYADQFDPLVGAVVEGAHQPGIGPPGVGHLNVGGLLLIVLEVPFVHDHLSAGVDGLIDEIMRGKT